MTRYTLLAYVQNNPGVLNKITGLIRRKMYNIDSLTVSNTSRRDISAITLTLSAEEVGRVRLMMKQIEKLPEVMQIRNLDPEKSFWREVALIKCEITDTKLDIIKETCNVEVLYDDPNSNFLILQLAGRSRDIDICISEISKIIEITRSGVTSIEVGDNSVIDTFIDKNEEKNKTNY
jgi:acetolactate synthase I/III small subunit